MRKISQYVVPLTILSLLTGALKAQAGTAAYFGVCSFHDRGNNNGGSITQMPCYLVEGGNIRGAFTHFAWQDGVVTQLNAQAGEPLSDSSTGRTYERISYFTWVAQDDGDVITIENPEYSSSRYDVADPVLRELLK
jgi:hypothetical protein